MAAWRRFDRHPSDPVGLRLMLPAAGSIFASIRLSRFIRMSDIQLDQFFGEHAVLQAQLGDRDRQGEAARAGTAGIDIKNTVHMATEGAV